MYVDLAGLARYKQDLDAWARGSLLPKDAAAARVRTAKAGAVSFVPVQQTPLDVSVDFLFSETPPASGDKGPDNPSTITGVSEVRVFRASANLLPETYSLVTSIDAPLTVVQNSDGSITINGATLSNKNAYSYIFGQANDYSNKNVDYPIPASFSYSWGYTVVSGTASITDSGIATESTPIALQVMRGTGVGNASIMANSTSDTESTRQNDTPVWIKMRVALWKNYTFNNYRIKPHLRFTNLSVVSETSGAPCGEIYILPLGNTYYGGTLDVATGVMTVKSQKVAIDGSCSYVYLGGLGNGTGFVAVVVTIHALEVTKGYFATGSCACSRFPVFSTETPEFTKAGMFLANPNLSYFNYKQVRFYLSLDMLGLSSSATQQEVASAAKAWFTANPTDAVFTFAEPFSTVQLTPTEILSLTQPDPYTPRTNTVYSDASAVQVGYLKHPSAASADLRNAAVSLGGGV